MKTGTTLKNGAKLLQHVSTEDGGIVLCDTDGLSAHKYATWRTNVEGDTFWGHYFQDLDEARADFNERADKLRR